MCVSAAGCIALLLFSAATVPAYAAETPVAGRTLRLIAGAEAKTRKVSILLKDPAIAAPPLDPRLGATLRIHAGSEC
ncbi:MAG: hypothetical protein ABFS41_09440, partial [Myxococcota bacterium]